MLTREHPLAEIVYSDRACSPEVTLARVEPLLDHYGISRLARITGLDCIGIPVWNAIRPNARSIAIHQGKGITDMDARVSATMEALERAIAEDPKLPVRRASRHQLTADGLESDALHCLIAAGNKVPDDMRAMDWVEGHDLITGGPIWVPRDAVTLDRTKTSLYWQSSDGLASGNTYDEAHFHALLERIERDAEVLWKLGTAAERAATCVDPRSLGDPVVDGLLDQIGSAGFRIQMFDLTSDLGIPVVSALLAPAMVTDMARLRHIDVTMGSGAHPFIARAAIRAITEAVQSRLTLISGARDDVPPDLYARPLSEGLKRDLQFAARPNRRADAATVVTGLAQMLTLVLERLVDQKLGPVIAVRMTDDERLAVVKMLVPKLENPEGARRQPLQGRAMKKMLVFR